MHLYTVNAEQTIFHSIAILAKSESEAMKTANELIKEQRAFSTAQQIDIINVMETKY